jgi:hypothetical protein
LSFGADVFREIDAPIDWWAPIRQRLMLSLDIKEVVAKKKAVVVYISRCVYCLALHRSRPSFPSHADRSDLWGADKSHALAV